MMKRSLLYTALLLGPFLLSSCSGSTGSSVLISSPGELDFGAVEMGESAELTFAVSAQGSLTVELQEPSYSGEGESPFALSGANFPISLEPEESITFTALFSPQSAGSYAAILTMSGVPQAGVSGAGLSSSSDSPLVGSAALLLVGEALSVGGDDDDSGSGSDDDDGDDDDDDGDDDDTSECIDNDGDNWCLGEDCDDSNAAVHPNAIETCDGADNDCDILIDEDAVDSDTWYADSDGDGYGGSRFITESCEAPAGYVNNDLDCDDLSAASYPGAPELCDESDNDCDALIDEEVVHSWYADSDGDGYGDPSSVVSGCVQPPGTSSNSLDCDDAVVTTNPAAWEVCDSIDNNCDQVVDEATALDAITWYVDADSDSYGDGSVPSITACAAGAGYADNDQDCNDSNANVYPGQSEQCDGIDNNCDGFLSPQELDGDGDTFSQCDGDCDEGNAGTYPGATEICNGGDEDCDGVADNGAGSTWYLDFDGDGYGDSGSPLVACVMPSGYSGNSNDCDDGNGIVSPGTIEQCDGLDNDCDTAIDEGTLNTWFADSDGDGYGDNTNSLQACSLPTGYVSTGGDCDDATATTHPGSYEVCDGSDNDCDTVIDEGAALGGITSYADGDADGYGVTSSAQQACAVASGRVTLDGDCDDVLASINPGATEVWYDGTDQDCSGGSDFDQDGDGFDSDEHGGSDCNDLDGSVFENCALFAFASHTFTPCGITGRFGPTISDCQSSYSTIWDENGSFFSMNTQGIQRFTVPETGVYQIVARGAGGGASLNNNGGFPGRGAVITGEFSLTQGDVLQILVGQKGDDSLRVGGPGGGTFVVASDNTPLIVAGGGGAGRDNQNDQTGNGNGNADATDAETANDGASGCDGGSNGNGGQSCGYPGGGGLLSDGGDSTSNNDAQGGGSFLNGGIGGNCTQSCFNNSGAGGFGGGGGTWHDAHPGGGGGYSGGGGGSYAAGGGGGSFNSGANQSSSVGDNGNAATGSVFIVLL